MPFAIWLEVRSVRASPDFLLFRRALANHIPPGRIPKAANWAFGAFFISSIVQWEYCRAQRAREYAAMARAIEIMDKKAAEKAAKMKEEAEKLKLEQERAAKKSWYKFW